MRFVRQATIIKVINFDDKTRVTSEKEIRKRGNMLPTTIRGIICGPSNYETRWSSRLLFINNIESLFDRLDEEENRRQEILSEKLARTGFQTTHLDDLVEWASSSGGTSHGFSQKSAGGQSNISEEWGPEAGPSSAKRSRGTVNIFNDEKVVAALDKSKVSNRNAVHLVAAIVQALGTDVTTLALNTSSIRLSRQKIRARRAEKVKSYFNTLELKALVVHYDGKLMQDINTKSKTERLPVVVANGQIEKILHVPALNDSKGETQAEAVYEVLNDWGLTKSVKAICCDTTASNMGIKNGSAVLLESLLMTDILFLPCRHYIFELVLRCVFENNQPETTGPNVPLFKNFQQNWKNIDQSKYKSGIVDKKVRNSVTCDDVDRISTFVKLTLETRQPRDDYKEFLELTLIYLGCTPSDKVSFHIPGAYHHARFMAKRHGLHAELQPEHQITTFNS
ncbi:uncharacterized protein LOC115241023 [Formica exsecta]|uniref:uncharacterized protein LOC115241023 n=1 Tax=Formica exsecta TaxID=72781 RepID=UPI00114462BA|nr:uncharacterized protein LOC115241023 [Formica exsecta]